MHSNRHGNLRDLPRWLDHVGRTEESVALRFILRLSRVGYREFSRALSTTFRRDRRPCRLMHCLVFFRTCDHS